MKKIVLLSTLGYPGSGKTYFAERFSKKHNFFHLNSDYTRLELFSDPTYSPEETKIVIRAMNLIARNMLVRGVSVIFDANSTKMEHRKDFEKMAKKIGARHALLWFKTPVETALRRIQNRDFGKSKEKQKYYRPLDKQVLFLIKNEEEHPTKEKHLILDGEASYASNEKLVERFLKKI